MTNQKRQVMQLNIWVIPTLEGYLTQKGSTRPDLVEPATKNTFA